MVDPAKSSEDALFTSVLNMADQVGAESSLLTQACIPLATQGVDGDDGEQALMDLVKPIKPQQLQACGNAHLNNSQFLTFVKSVFKGSPTNTAIGLRRRVMLYTVVIDALIANKFVHSQASEAVVNFLITEADHLPLHVFPGLFDQILKVFVYKEDSSASSRNTGTGSERKHISPLEFVPSFIHCIQNATKGQLQQDGDEGLGLHEMTGKDFKAHAIKQICSSEWPDSQTLESATILREISPSFEGDIAELVLEKLLEEVNRAPLEVVPKVSLQLLTMISTCAKMKGNKSEVALNHLIAYFDGVAARTPPVVGLARVEGSMLSIFHMVASQHPDIGRSFIKLCKLGRNGINKLTYFRIALLLALSKIKRFEGQVHQCLFSRVELSINYAARCITSNWLQEINSKEQVGSQENSRPVSVCEGFDTAIDTLVSRCLDGGWDLVVQALPGFGNSFMNYWNAYSSSMVICGDLHMEVSDAASTKSKYTYVDPRICASIYGRSVLFHTFKSHSINRRIVIGQLCERIAGASASSATGGSLQAIRLLKQLAQATPVMLLEDANSLKEIITYLPRMFPRIAHGTIQALDPLFKMRPDLIELLVLVLRKAAFQRDESCRVVAVNGLMYLCFHGLLRSFDSEFFGSLRRFLTYGKSIRSCLYRAMARVYEKNDSCRDMVVELICTQFEKATDAKQDGLILKHFVNSVEINSSRALEPMARLVQLTVDCQLAQPSPKLEPTLTAFRERICSCDVDSEVESLAKHVNKVDESSAVVLELVIGTVEQLLRWCAETGRFDEMHRLFEQLSKFMDAYAALKSRDGNKRRKKGTEEVITAESPASVNNTPLSSLDLKTLQSLLKEASSEQDTSGGRLQSYAVNNLMILLLDARWTAESLAKDGKCLPSRKFSAQESSDRVQGTDRQSLDEMMDLSCGGTVSSFLQYKLSACKAVLPLLIAEVYKLVDESEDSTLLTKFISCIRECLVFGDYCGKVEEVIGNIVFENGDASLPNMLHLVQAKICDVLFTPANLKSKPQELVAALDLHQTICKLCEKRRLSLSDSARWVKEKCAATATRNVKLSSKLTEVYLFLEYRVQNGATDLVCVEKLCGAIQKTLGQLESDGDSQNDVAEESSQTFAFLIQATSSNVIKEVVTFLNESMLECEWVVSELKRYPSSLSTAAKDTDQDADAILCGAAAARKIHESMLFARLEAIAMCLTILTNTNLPRAGQAKSKAAEDVVIKSLIKFYKLIALQLKLAVSTKQKVFVSSLQRLINRVAKELTSNVYQLLPFIQTHDQEENRSNAANITKELRTIPELIYSIEDFEVQLLKLSKVNPCTADLARFVKPSSNRDFKIQQKAAPQKQKKRVLKA